MRNRKKPREATRVILTETSVKISATVYIVKLREFCCKTKKKGENAQVTSRETMTGTASRNAQC